MDDDIANGRDDMRATIVGTVAALVVIVGGSDAMAQALHKTAVLSARPTDVLICTCANPQGQGYAQIANIDITIHPLPINGAAGAAVGSTSGAMGANETRQASAIAGMTANGAFGSSTYGCDVRDMTTSDWGFYNLTCTFEVASQNGQYITAVPVTSYP